MNEQFIHINKRQLLAVSIESFLYILLPIYFTVAYILIPYDIKANIISKCFLAYIICISSNLIRVISKFRCHYKYWGEYISPAVWNRLLHEKRYYQKFINFMNLLCFCFGCYFAVYFNSKECYIYNTHETFEACNSMNIIVTLTWLYGAMLLINIMHLLARLWVYCDTKCNDYKRKKRNISFVEQFLDNYNPLPIPPQDTVCAICLTDTEDEINESELINTNNNWLELICKHKYHVTCITEWFKYNTSCPYCKKPVLLNNQTNAYNSV